MKGFSQRKDLCPIHSRIDTDQLQKEDGAWPSVSLQKGNGAHRTVTCDMALHGRRELGVPCPSRCVDRKVHLSVRNTSPLIEVRPTRKHIVRLLTRVDTDTNRVTKHSAPTQRKRTRLQNRFVLSSASEHESPLIFLCMKKRAAHTSVATDRENTPKGSCDSQVSCCPWRRTELRPFPSGT